MNHISLFSGIGGFDLASEWMGWCNVLSCEIADFPNRILEYYWPEAYHHRDIHTLTPEIIEKELKERFGSDWRSDGVILTGGFPCQPFSAAGKRKGTEDSRHLWPEMLRVIRGIRPDYIVGENVAGLVNWSCGMVFEEVFIDLEDEGYEVGAFMVPACATGAPHRRDRIWFIAYRNCTSAEHSIQSGRYVLTSEIDSWVVANTAGNGLHDQSTTKNNLNRPDNQQQRAQRLCPLKGFSDERFTTNTYCAGWEKHNATAITEKQRYHSGIDISERTTWQDFPTQPPICSGDDGLPAKLDGITFPKWRNESIKGYGNAVVPQVVYEFFKMIEAHKKIFSEVCNISDR